MKPTRYARVFYVVAVVLALIGAANLFPVRQAVIAGHGWLAVSTLYGTLTTWLAGGAIALYPAGLRAWYRIGHADGYHNGFRDGLRSGLTAPLAEVIEGPIVRTVQERQKALGTSFAEAFRAALDEAKDADS